MRKTKFDAMIEEIRRRGGIVGISDKLPAEVAEAFLEDVLDCPLCNAMEARLAGRDRVFRPPPKSGH